MNIRPYIQNYIQSDVETKPIFDLQLFEDFDRELHDQRTKLHGASKRIITATMSHYISDFLSKNNETLLKHITAPKAFHKWKKIFQKNIINLLTSPQYTELLNEHLIATFNKKTLSGHRFIRLNYEKGRLLLRTHQIGREGLQTFDEVWFKIVSPPGKKAQLNDMLDLEVRLSSRVVETVVMNLIKLWLILIVLYLSDLKPMNSLINLSATIGLTTLAGLLYAINQLAEMFKNYERHAFDPSSLMKDSLMQIHEEYAPKMAYVPKNEIEKPEADSKHTTYAFSEEHKRTTPKIKTRNHDQKVIPPHVLLAQPQPSKLETTEPIEIGTSSYYKILNQHNTYYRHDASDKTFDKMFDPSTHEEAVDIIEKTLKENPNIEPVNSKRTSLKYNTQGKGNEKIITFKFYQKNLASTRINIATRSATLEESSNLGEDVEILSPKKKGYK